jgi:aspartyl-tRNA(Asn)/glutamyl-tRNA(Gln) amidotransferase subunit A
MAAWAPIAEIADGVRSGKLKATDLVEQALSAIEEKAEYQAIIVTTAERARERAKQTDAEPKGRLAGVPFIAKDNFLVYGAETTAASNILQGFTAPYQSTAVERLEAEGAICVAKANLDAFAHGSSTENSDFFTTKNPHDQTRFPGGSSGGSAAAVMLDMAPFALGTDTGGSVRLPASFCGAVGYKPTYGLVSRSGVVAMASSTDVVGPLTTSVADAALVVDVMAGRDDLDSTTIERDERGYQTDNVELAGVKIGKVKEYFESDGLSPAVKKLNEQALEKLQAAGAEIIDVSLPSLPLALAVYYVLCPAEVSSNLSRYDGQRYGFSKQNAKDIADSYTGSREQGFGKEAKRRIMIGTYVLSSGYYDAYYKRAQAVRTKLIKESEEAFESVDFLVGPTAADVAFKIGENTADPLKMYLTDIMTVAANLTGSPAVSLPCGDVDGLPVGLQLIAAQRHDRQLLGLAHAVEGLLA